MNQKKETEYPVLELVPVGSGIDPKIPSPIGTGTDSRISGPTSTGTGTNSIEFDRVPGPAHPCLQLMRRSMTIGVASVCERGNKA